MEEEEAEEEEEEEEDEEEEEEKRRRRRRRRRRKKRRRRRFNVDGVLVLKHHPALSVATGAPGSTMTCVKPAAAARPAGAPPARV